MFLRELRSRFEQRFVDWLFFNTSIGSPHDFERPRVVHGGVIKFRIFFKFFRFRSHDLARTSYRLRLVVRTDKERDAKGEREKQAGTFF